ncbi:MAG: type II toxin-antitoxin system RelE/ParE family toxin [Archangium sp.]|nr:type II toxin-antitoxin system RelE/ParE family toxin [Archangium sp.]
MRRYEVRFTDSAREDLLELHAFLAEHSVDAAEAALGTIERGLRLLEEFPWSCRASTAVPRSRFRELVIPFGRRGYVALFELEGDDVVTILAVRHQRESDYH